MSVSKLSFPKLNDLEEDIISEVTSEAKTLEDSAEKISTDISEGVKEVEEKIKTIGEDMNAPNPLEKTFSGVPQDDSDIKKSDEVVSDDGDDGDIVSDDGDEATEDTVPVDEVEDSDDEELSDDDNEKSEQDESASKKAAESMSKVIENTLGLNYVSSDEDTDSDEDDSLQKFDEDVRKNYLLDFHPEAQAHNYDEVKMFATVKRNKRGDIIDPLHRTIPILTKYEKTRVLGQRAKQINSGAPSTIKVPDTTMDGYLVALEELRQKKIPFIIRRPIPNGGFEYWKISDLEFLE